MNKQGHVESLHPWFRFIAPIWLVHMTSWMCSVWTAQAPEVTTCVQLIFNDATHTALFTEVNMTTSRATTSLTWVCGLTFKMCGGNRQMCDRVSLTRRKRRRKMKTLMLVLCGTIPTTSTQSRTWLRSRRSDGIEFLSKLWTKKKSHPAPARPRLWDFDLPNSAMCVRMTSKSHSMRPGCSDCGCSQTIGFMSDSFERLGIWPESDFKASDSMRLAIWMGREQIRSRSLVSAVWT